MKTLLKIKYILIFLLIQGCASKKIQSIASSVSNQNLQLKDKSGVFRLERESGPVAKLKNVFAVKRILKDDENKILEQSVVISKLGSLKGKISILRPEKSQYTVWFDGKEYSTSTQIDTANKSLGLSLNSPEEQWRGQKSVPFPRNGLIYCYFSQLVECILATGFIHKAIDSGNGEMNLHILWEGYPYIQQQYVGLPDEVFSSATFTYDGENERGLRRFSLNIKNSNQLIFYQLNKSDELKGIFWPAQGLSIGEPGSPE